MRFSEWLRAEIKKRGWSQEELAERMGITPAQVSYVLNEQRGPGDKFCRDLAYALKMSEIAIFVQAGRMSQTTNPEELTLRELYAILSELPPEEQRAILHEARARCQIRRQRPAVEVGVQRDRRVMWSTVANRRVLDGRQHVPARCRCPEF